MTDFLIEHATLLTCDAQRRVLDDHALAIIDGRIAALGAAADLAARYASLTRFDARGLAILPGFVNAHTHTVLMALKGSVEDWSGEAIYRYMTPISYAMTADERAAIATLGCIEAIRSGTTTLVDPFRHVATYVEAIAATGMRAWVSEACADIDTRKIRHGDYTVDAAFGAAFVERATALIAQYHGSHGDRIRCQVAAHAPDNCSPRMLKTLRKLADQHGLTRTIHLSQGLSELNSVQSRYGMTSAAYLDREGFLGPDLLAAHWSFCSASDIDLLARRGVMMAHTPASISRKGMHKAQLGKILDAGIDIALGTDNMSQDMFQALTVGAIVQRTGRGRDQEGGVLPGPQRLLDMATRAGAQAVGAADDIGSIEVGKKADLNFIDLGAPALRPIIRLISNIVHYGHPGVVHSVMVDGRFLMRDRKILTVDEAAILEQAEQATRRVWRRMMQANPDLRDTPDPIPWLQHDTLQHDTSGGEH